MSLIKLTDDSGHDDLITKFKECFHPNRIINRIYDVTTYHTSYDLCAECAQLPEFSINIISEKEIIN